MSAPAPKARTSPTRRSGHRRVKRSRLPATREARAFWSGALGYESVGAAGSYVLLLPPEGKAGPQLLLQRVPEPKVGKNRMHLDIHTVDIEREADRLLELGAIRLDEQPLSEHGTNWILMQDPEGNEFCVCDGGSGA